MAVVCYYRDRFVSEEAAFVPLEDRGHLFGDGVYEVVRVYGGRPFLLEWHFERFERSLDVVGIGNPMSRAEWVDLVNEAVRRSGEPDAVLYWQVTRGAAARMHTFPDTKPIVSLTVRPFQKPQSAAAALLAWPDERWANAYVKSINLLPNVLAREAAHRAGASEALLVRDGYMLEGAGSNAWFVVAGELVTAPANRYILGGVTRRLVLELAHTLGLTVHEQAWPLDRLHEVDEVFMTSTTSEILPISKVTVHPSVRAALRHLPDEPPATLLSADANVELLWEQRGEAAVTTRLTAAFTETVEALRTAADPMQLPTL